MNEKGSYPPYLLFGLIPLGVVGETLAIIILLCRYRWWGVMPALAIAVVLFTHFLLTGLWWNYPALKTFQQIFLIVIYYIGYSTFFKRISPDIDTVWEKYLKICFCFSIIAWFQFAVYLGTGIDLLQWPGSHFLGNGLFFRLHSYFEEPASYATFLTPYVVYFLLNGDIIKQNVLKFTSVFFTYLLTISSIGFFVLFLVVIYKIYNSRYRIILLFLLAMPILFLGANLLEKNDTFQNDTSQFEQSIAKISETATAFSNLSPGEFEMLNPSTYAIVSNFWVAVNAPNRLLGNGIGSHVHSYDTIYTSDFEMYGLNRSDAFSLFTRIFSEFGLFGLLCMGFFLFYFSNKQNPINISSAFFVIACLIRGGHYTLNGFFLFLFLFVLSSGKLKSQHEEIYVDNI